MRRGNYDHNILLLNSEKLSNDSEQNGQAWSKIKKGRKIGGKSKIDWCLLREITPVSYLG